MFDYLYIKIYNFMIIAFICVAALCIILSAGIISIGLPIAILKYLFS